MASRGHHLKHLIRGVPGWPFCFSELVLKDGVLDRVRMDRVRIRISRPSCVGMDFVKRGCDLLYEWTQGNSRQDVLGQFSSLKNVSEAEAAVSFFDRIDVSKGMLHRLAIEMFGVSKPSANRVFGRCFSNGVLDFGRWLSECSKVPHRSRVSIANGHGVMFRFYCHPLCRCFMSPMLSQYKCSLPAKNADEADRHGIRIYGKGYRLDCSSDRDFDGFGVREWLMLMAVWSVVDDFGGDVRLSAVYETFSGRRWSGLRDDARVAFFNDIDLILKKIRLFGKSREVSLDGKRVKVSSDLFGTPGAWLGVKEVCVDYIDKVTHERKTNFDRRYDWDNVGFEMSLPVLVALSGKSVVPVPSEMMPSRVGDVTQFYLGYRVLKCEAMSDTQTVIRYDAVRDVAGEWNGNVARDYMERAVKAGHVAGRPVFGRGRIEFDVVGVSRPVREIVVEVRDAEGNRIDMELSRDAEERNAVIVSYNRFARRHKVSHNGIFLDTDLHAVFNLDWTRNGRMYTRGRGHQSLSGDERRRILIDGQEVCELDFACYHTNMLYAERGLELDGDGYDFLPDRGRAKVALNILYNTSSRDDAIGTIAHELGVTWTKAVEVVEAAERRHHAISDAFCSDAGARLMNVDSAIMLDVMRSMMRKGRLVLPVHDSCVCRRCDRKMLMKAMDKSYRKVFGRGCPIKEK